MSVHGRGHQHPTVTDEEMAPVVGANLRRLRSRRGLSLQRLARRAGVSRAMLSQIENGHTSSSINLLWKVARALDVTFSTLVTRRKEASTTVLPARESLWLANHSGTFTSRALFPFDGRRRSEFYELRLTGNSEEIARPHPPGTVENLVVAASTVEVGVEAAVHRLETGDAIVFGGDVPHRYRNVTDGEAVMYLVMTYAEEIG